MRIHVLRSRTSQHVAYYPHGLEKPIADCLRHRGGVMHKAMFWNFPVEMRFPEVLLQGYCFGRTSKNLPQDKRHTALEIANDQFATYLPENDYLQAQELVASDERLYGASITLVDVMVPDIEALTHGEVVEFCQSRDRADIQKFAMDNFMRKYDLKLPEVQIPQAQKQAA